MSDTMVGFIGGMVSVLVLSASFLAYMAIVSREDDE